MSKLFEKKKMIFCRVAQPPRKTKDFTEKLFGVFPVVLYKLIF